MILPASAHFNEYKKYPMTLVLLLSNILIFVLIFSANLEDYSQQKIFADDGLEVTGKIYYQFLETLSDKEKSKRPDWLFKMQVANNEQMETLGAYALRDASFSAAVDKIKIVGDEIKIAEWRKYFNEFKTYYAHLNIFIFGLHSAGAPLTWLTYQFSHSGWMHLLSNMIFFLAVAFSIESLVGSGLLLFVYLAGGFAGGALFLLMNSHGTVPMVGASASISALMAFYCIIEPRKRIRYLYFVSPLPKQYGFIYLPTMLIVPLFLVVDFASLLATPDGWGGGVAYAAHVGGTLLGLLVGLLVSWQPVRKHFFVKNT